MFIKVLVLTLSFGSSYQVNKYFGSLEVVSDLQPEDCLSQEEDYYEADSTYGLPRCSDSFLSAHHCTKYYRATYAKYVVYLPTCDADGGFAPKQCKGDVPTGRCFCFSSKGYRIWGQEWWAAADDMTCACSRKKSDMSDPTLDNYVFFNSLHCDSMGNYEPLQCDQLSEQCWCADPKTGDLLSSVVPMKTMTKLPCYETLKTGSQYLRQCENKLYAQKTIENQLSLRGSNSKFGDFLCWDDGSYGAYTIVDGIGYCTWRDNTKIGSWASQTPSPELTTCHCAFDTKIYEQTDVPMQLKCNSTGDYDPMQGTTVKYCVDGDGFTKSDGRDIREETDCDQFIAYVESH